MLHELQSIALHSSRVTVNIKYGLGVNTDGITIDFHHDGGVLPFVTKDIRLPGRSTLPQASSILRFLTCCSWVFLRADMVQLTEHFVIGNYWSLLFARGDNAPLQCFSCILSPQGRLSRSPCFIYMYTSPLTSGRLHRFLRYTRIPARNSDVINKRTKAMDREQRACSIDSHRLPSQRQSAAPRAKPTASHAGAATCKRWNESRVGATESAYCKCDT